MSKGRTLSSYWIEVSTRALGGFGVTAFSPEDAMRLVAEANLDVGSTEPAITEVRFDELDTNHVVPNMGVISRRGVWYPNLNS